MRNRYVFLRIISVFCLLLLLMACSSHSQPLRIGVSQCSDDEWRHQMNKEILREANFYDDVVVEIRTAGDDNTRQAEDIRRFIAEKVDLLVVAPNEAAPITPVVEEAYSSGIPVIVVDRKILSDKYTAYIGADNYEIGVAVGNYVANILHGQGNIVEIGGLVGSTPAIDRHQGFMKALSNYPDIRVLATEDGAWLRQRAQEKMDTLLQQFPRIDLVFAQNDRMAAGAYAAAAARNRADEMRFVGIDALPGKDFGVEQVLAGQLDATFIYPTGGDRVMQIAMDILNRHDFPHKTILNTSVVDASNAPIMKMQTAHIGNLDAKIETLSGRMNLFLDRFATQQVVLYGSLLGLLVVVALLVAVYLTLRSKNRMNRELSLQKTQLMDLSRELEAATHAKLAFFTNVSHDFRTPLTLIADPIERLLTDISIAEPSRQLLQLMQKNVHILLRLVNQILDFRKVENGRMEFHPEVFDPASSLRSWNDSFHAAFQKKDIRFVFDVQPGGNFCTLADVEQMERVYFNLLSNAVKYTPQHGHITVCLKSIPDEARVCFSVFNSGSRISPSDVEAVFERFYQVDGHREGTGIGLALVRAFVEMHGGTITVESNEQGTTFLVSLPLHAVLAPPVPTTPTTIELSIIDADSIGEEEVLSADYPTVLIIDDNADIRTYVKSLLTKEYRVLDAADGATGIRLAMKYVPDVVVSDVMMPGMDGVECCRRLKSELQTCHIPVILLTACSLDEQRIQGYDGGADSYISKPFNSQLLLSRIRNLITNRRQLKQFLGDGQTIEKESVGDLDKDFVSRFRGLIEEKMREPELNVEDLGREMGMSRVQLYRKLKSLTNYSPNELLRQIRLKRAASLLAATEMTVAEVAYEVGFSSPSYFTKCYREQFGESPTDFLKRRG